MCRCHLAALRPTRRALQASAEEFTEGHIAAQFTEPQQPSAIRAVASTLQRIDTAPNISLHQPAVATTCHLSVSRHLTATVSRVRSAWLPPPSRTGLEPVGRCHRGRGRRDTSPSRSLVRSVTTEDASDVAARRTFIGDQSGGVLHRGDPQHLLHRGFAARAREGACSFR